MRARCSALGWRTTRSPKRVSGAPLEVGTAARAASAQRSRQRSTNTSGMPEMWGPLQGARQNLLHQREYVAIGGKLVKKRNEAGGAAGALVEGSASLTVGLDLELTFPWVFCEMPAGGPPIRG